MNQAKCTLDLLVTKRKQSKKPKKWQLFSEKPSIYRVFRWTPHHLGTLPPDLTQGGHPTSVLFRLNKIFINMDNSFNFNNTKILHAVSKKNELNHIINQLNQVIFCTLRPTLDA